MTYYTGIGSKNTPQNIKDIMYRLGYKLATKGYTLRSGGARGADNAFEMGANDAKGSMEIYLPYDGYQGRYKKQGEHKYYIPSEFNNYDKAIKITNQFHEYFKELSEKEKKFIVRDTYQVLGKDLNTLSNFVVCWTADRVVCHKERTKETGGTGQAISTASYYSLPLFNLKIKSHLTRIIKYLDDIKDQDGQDFKWY